MKGDENKTAFTAQRQCVQTVGGAGRAVEVGRLGACALLAHPRKPPSRVSHGVCQREIRTWLPASLGRPLPVDSAASTSATAPSRTVSDPHALQASQDRSLPS